jgi:predicted AlkP superfamily pyrophosphatase or phosphodiesterase
LSAAFPHTFRKAEGASPFWAFTLAPQANDLVVETALAAVVAEALGQDDEPDLLALQLAANDYIGHAFGPYSPEVMDITLRTDVQLARLLAGLEQAVPGGLDRVLIALSADHGVSPIQEELKAAGFAASRLSGEAILQRVERALDDRFGARDWVHPGGKYLPPNLWISPNAILQASELDPAATPAEIRAQAASALRHVEGIYAAYTREDVLSGRVPHSRLGRAITAGFHPKLSGDVFVVLEPYRVVRSEDAAEHGAPWTYDTHVPLLLAGPGIAPGRKDDPVSPEDLAPTLAWLLGIGPPGAAEGRLLRSALK